MGTWEALLVGGGAESGSAWVLLDFIKLNTVELRSRSEYGIKAPDVLSLKQFLAVLTEIELSGYAMFILLQSFISPHPLKLEDGACLELSGSHKRLLVSPLVTESLCLEVDVSHREPCVQHRAEA